MPNYSIYQGNVHLGELKAFSTEEALKSAKKLYPDAGNLRAELNRDNEERVNPMSAIEMRRALDAMVGKAKPMAGRRMSENF